MTHPTDALRLVPSMPTVELNDDMLFKVETGETVTWGELKRRQYEQAVRNFNTMREDGSLPAPASPLPGGGNILWMMHVRGPDDIYPAPDYETAVAWCDYVNDVLAKRLPDVMMKAVPAVYPRTREEHAAGLPDAIKGWTLPAAPTGEPK